MYTRDEQKYLYSLSIFGMLEEALLKDGYEDLSEDTPTMSPLTDEDIKQVIDDEKC